MRLSYQDRGEGEVIVWLHSYLWDSKMWEPQLEKMEKNYRCIAINLPSHDGKVRNLTKDYSLKDLAREVQELLEDLKIEKYHYIGLSVGGMLAPYLYEIDAEKILSCVIMDAYSGAEGKEKHALYFYLLDQIESLGKIPEAMADKIASMFFAKHRIGDFNPDYRYFKNRLMSFSSEELKDIVILGRAIFGALCQMVLVKKTQNNKITMEGEIV